jgi:hypothetical protein
MSQPEATPTGGNIVEVGERTVGMISRWNSQQVLVVGSVLSMVVAYSLIIWDKYETRNDRRDERTQRNNADDTRARLTDVREEKDRKFRELEKEKDRIAHTTNLKMVVDHCAESGKVVRELSKSIGELNIQIKKISNMDEISWPPPSILPHPRISKAKENSQQSSPPSYCEMSPHLRLCIFLLRSMTDHLILPYGLRNESSRQEDRHSSSKTSTNTSPRQRYSTIPWAVRNIHSD